MVGEEEEEEEDFSPGALDELLDDDDANDDGGEDEPSKFALADFGFEEDDDSFTSHVSHGSGSDGEGMPAFGFSRDHDDSDDSW